MCVKAKYNGDVELALRSSAGSAALEGITITKEDMEDGRKILNGELDPDENIRALIAQYTKEGVS